MAQLVQRSFDEWNVDVGTIKNRFVSASVFGDECVRDQFLSHIGRVADHEMNRERQLGEQEIVMESTRYRCSD